MPRQSPKPPSRQSTARRGIIELLQTGQTLSAKAISKVVRIAEKEVYEHLTHIHRTFRKDKEYTFVVVPAECRRCDYVFEDRNKLKKPSRCPECRQQSIEDPLFSLRSTKSTP